MPTYSSILSSDATENIIVKNTVATLTLPDHFSSSGVNAGRARIKVRKAPILYTLNGVDPIVGDDFTGSELDVGSTLILNTIAEMNSLKVIQAKLGKTGEIFVQYDRRLN